MDFTTPPPNMEPVAIYNDGGGLVDQYRVAAWRYRTEGRQVKILGSCRSACVLALSVPNVCVGSGAVVKAHHAYELGSKKLRPDITQAIMRELPDNIRGEIEPNVQKDYNDGSTLTYSEMRSLGIPDCSQVKPEKRMIAAPKPKKVKSIRVVAKGPSYTPLHKIFDMFTKGL